MEQKASSSRPKSAFLLAEAQHWWMRVPVRYLCCCFRPYAPHCAAQFTKSALFLVSYRPLEIIGAPAVLSRHTAVRGTSAGRRDALVHTGVAAALSATRAANWRGLAIKRHQPADTQRPHGSSRAAKKRHGPQRRASSGGKNTPKRQAPPAPRRRDPAARPRGDEQC